MLLHRPCGCASSSRLRSCHSNRYQNIGARKVETGWPVKCLSRLYRLDPEAFWIHLLFFRYLRTNRQLNTGGTFSFARMVRAHMSSFSSQVAARSFHPFGLEVYTRCSHCVSICPGWLSVAHHTRCDLSLNTLRAQMLPHSVVSQQLRKVYSAEFPFKMSGKVSKATLKEIYERMDKNHDGTVDYHELKLMIMEAMCCSDDKADSILHVRVHSLDFFCSRNQPERKFSQTSRKRVTHRKRLRRNTFSPEKNNSNSTFLADDTDHTEAGQRRRQANYVCGVFGSVRKCKRA